MLRFINIIDKTLKINKEFFKLFFKLFGFSLVISIILYLLNYIYFPSNSVFFNEDGSSYCLEISKFGLDIFNLDFEYIYPESCDQERYYSVFSSPVNLISTQHPYQTRPVFVIFIYLINSIIKAFVYDNPIFSLQISTLIGHSLILSLGTSIILNTFKKLSDLKFYEKLILHSLILFSPLIKYALFDPSHQTITYLNIAIMAYVIKSYGSINFSKFSMIIGILFLAHRPFLLVFVIYFFYLTKFKVNLNNILLGIKGSIYVLTPYIVYRLMILSFGYEVYDGLTKKWGQFIWILDFLRGRVKYESDWHCVTVPENFICYIDDTFNSLLFLLIPVLTVATMFLTKKFSTNIESVFLKSGLYYYLFWSLIGWYPPLRFNLYSLNYLFILLLFIGYMQTENSMEKYLLISSNFVFFISSSHWNNPDILTINYISRISYSLFGLYFVCVLINYFRKTFDRDTGKP